MSITKINHKTKSAPQHNNQDSQMLLSLEQLKKMEKKVATLTDPIDWDNIYSETPEWKSVMKQLKPFAQGVVANCFFNIKKSKTSTGICFEIFSPSPFENDSNWEHDLIPDFINKLGFSSEHCYCYSGSDMNLTKQNWDSTCANLFKILLSVGMTPDEESFGYEQWLSNQKFKDDVPVFDRKQRMSLYFWECFKKNKASKNNSENTHVYSKPLDAQLKTIAKENILLNMTSLQWLSCKGDISSLSDLIDVAKSQQYVQSHLSHLDCPEKQVKIKSRKI